MENCQFLVILGSSRKESDTRFFVDELFSAMNKKVIDLLDYEIAPYNYEAKYPQTDQFNLVVDEILKYDKIIFATPVYWYSMSAHMKILFDRFTDLITTQKGKGRQLKGKSIFLIGVGADPQMPGGFEIPFELTSGYMGMYYKGHIYFSCEQKRSNEKKNEMKSFIQKVRD